MVLRMRIRPIVQSLRSTQWTIGRIHIRRPIRNQKFEIGFSRALAFSAMSANVKKAEDLERRLVLFAAQIVDVSTKLPRTIQGRHICSQIIRSGTATASNYGEARGAESRTDFVHKLKIVLKELNETSVWLQLIHETSLLSADKIVPIIAENAELCRIIAASIHTARRVQ